MPSEQFGIGYHAAARKSYEKRREEAEERKEAGRNFEERVNTVTPPTSDPKQGRTVVSRPLESTGVLPTFPVGSRRSESRPGDLKGRDPGTLPKGKK